MPSAQTLTDTSTGDPTVSVDAAAKLVGITRAHLWLLVERGEVPTVEVRGHIRICMSAVDELKTRCATTPPSCVTASPTRTPPVKPPWPG